MTRDPELDKAIRDLQPVYAKMRKFDADMKKPEVYQNLNVHHSVEVMAADLRSDIATRAGSLGMEPIALMALLEVVTREQGRLRRRPNAAQLARHLEDRAKRSREAADEARREAARATERAEDVARRAAAYARAYTVVTGYGI